MADWLEVQNIDHDNLNVKGEEVKVEDYKSVVFYTMRKMSF